MSFEQLVLALSFEVSLPPGCYGLNVAIPLGHATATTLSELPSKGWYSTKITPGIPNH